MAKRAVPSASTASLCARASATVAPPRNRQAQKRRARSVQVGTGVKSAVSKVREALEQGDGAAAKAALHAAERTIDRASSKGVLHRNAASRKIGRLATAVARLPASE
jgi:small subunit ribosomal protein S20